MPSFCKQSLSSRKLYSALGYIIVAMFILAASVLVPMHTFTVPPNDFMPIVWNQGQRLLHHEAVNLSYPYPLWTPIVMLPFALGSSEIGAQLWFVCNLLLLATSIVVLIDLLNWPTGLPLLVILTLFVGAFGPVFTTFWIGQLSFVSVLSLVLLARALKSGAWMTAGAVLGLGLLKPQLMIVMNVAIFGLAMWERRWKLFIGFGFVLALFVALSIPFAVTPQQIVGGGAAQHLAMYLARTSTLWGFSLTIAPGSLWFPALVSCALTVWLSYLWVHSVGTGRWSERILYLVSITTVVNLLILPYSWFYNQAVLILPICYAIHRLRRFDASARIFWLITLVLVVYFLPTAVDAALTRIYLSEVYQVIPVMCLLPVVAVIEWQAERKSVIAG